MDIHINLIINNKSQDKNINVECLEENDILFEFSEYDDVQICFQDLQDNLLQIDCMEKELYTVCENEIITISRREDNRRLVPGYYSVCIRTKCRRINLFFKILPKNIEWQSLLELRNRLNEFLNGINLDYNNYYSSNESENKSNIRERYNEKYLQWCRVKENIINLLKQPSNKLIKKYNYDNRLIKFDSRVIRRQQNMQGVNKYWQPKLDVSYNTNDNIALLEAIKKSIYDNFSTENLLINKKNQCITQKDYKVKEMKETYNYYNKIKNDLTITQKYKRSIENKLSFLKKEIYKQECIIEDFEKKIEIIKKIIKEQQEICYFIKNKMKIIMTNVIDLKVKDNRYKIIIEQLNKISNQFINQMNQNKKSGFSFKKTEVLFEYFCLFRIINELFNAQYTCMSDWLIEAIKDNYLTEIPSDKDIVFKKNNQDIIIQYDKEMPKKRTAINSNYDGIVSVNSEHRRPDISLIIKNNNIIECVLIFEVKYRNSRYIYNKDGDTEVMETLDDYSQLNYIINGKVIKDIVKKVVLLYPYQKNIVSCKDDIIKYIPVNVNAKACEEEIFKILSEYGIMF